METNDKTMITVQTAVHAPLDNVWKLWTAPEHITQWNHASDDWHTPWATNDVRPGGTFVFRMEAKDGSFGFDFNGVYTEIHPFELIAYTIEGGREVTVRFTRNGGATNVVETFEAEGTNPLEMQRAGWQAILENFKQYAEKHSLPHNASL